MSKDIELRHILPNGGRQSICSSENMSGSGSFHSSPPHDPSTDIVGGVTPVYSTVPEAQAAHSRYSSQQVKNSHGIQHNEYTSPVNVDPPNTYDLIPDNNKRQTDRSSPGVTRLEAENVLYGTPVDEKLKHRTLTMEKAKSEKHQDMRFTGSVSSPMLKEPADERACCTGKYCGVCLMLVLVFVVALLAVAALVLVLSVMFRIYPVCDCPSAKELQALKERIEQLEMVMPTAMAPQELQDDLIRSVNSSINSKVDALRSDVTTNLSRISDGSFLIGTNFSSTLSGINVFETCQTRIEGNCTIRVTPQGTIYPTPCLTQEIPQNVPGKYTLDIRCIRAGDTTDGGNALVGYLSFGPSFFGEEVVQCHCHIVVDNPDNRLTDNVTCGIQVTRCSLSQTLNITAQLVE